MSAVFADNVLWRTLLLAFVNSPELSLFNGTLRFGVRPRTLGNRLLSSQKHKLSSVAVAASVLGEFDLYSPPAHTRGSQVVHSLRSPSVGPLGWRQKLPSIQLGIISKYAIGHLIGSNVEEVKPVYGTLPFES